MREPLHDRPDPASVCALSLFLLIVLVLCASAIGSAQKSVRSPAPPGERVAGPSPGVELILIQSDAGASALLLARACWVEAGFSLADCAAINSVLKARAERSGWTYERMLWAYTALRRKNPRATFARKLPDGDEPTWNEADNARWSELRALAVDALAGNVPSPCGRAVHWGGLDIPSDAERAHGAVSAGRWRRVRCNGRLLNAYFAETKPRALSAVLAKGGGR